MPSPVQSRANRRGARSFGRGALGAALCGISVALGLAGCAHGRKDKALPPAYVGTNSAPRLIITPDTRLVGKIIRYYPEGRFAILAFPIGHLPASGQSLNVYRLGLKVGEMKVTRFQMDDKTVADLVAGEAQPGDEVRDW